MIQVKTKGKSIADIIAVIVTIITVICCIIPFITTAQITDNTMVSAFGENVELYGKGLYARNSFSGAVQAVAQDVITLLVVIPAMIYALVLKGRKKLLGRYLMTGLFGYLLYTYMSYSFLMYYNDLFLLYVADMTLSFYGLLLCITDLIHDPSAEKIREGLPTKGLRIFLMLSGAGIFLMWMGRIIPTIGQGTAPAGLDNCTTLVIQALDLGVIVPACFVISHLLKTKHKLGCILGPVIVIKAVTLVLAVLAMAFCMKINGVEVDSASFAVFIPVCAAAVYFFFRVAAQINKAEAA